MSEQPARSYTFRLSEIDPKIDKNDLEEYLNNLDYGDVKCEWENVMTLSWAPYAQCIVATVTFRHEPYEFAEIGPGRPGKLFLPEQFGILDGIPVDVDFISITPLHCGENAAIDIFAVSGLASHAFGSWRSRMRHNVMWLRDFLPNDLPASRIFTWGYDTDLRKDTDSHSILDFSRNLLDAVHSTRDLNAETLSRPIIFIAHGIGGIIVKQALNYAAGSASINDRNIIQACVGMLFFSVPNQGFNSTNLESLVKGQKNLLFVTSLAEESDFLRKIHQEMFNIFSKNLQFCKIVSFYETRATKTVECKEGKWTRSGPPVRMVGRLSATNAVPGEEFHEQIPVHADHYNMVKFDWQDNPTYMKLRMELNEIFEEKDRILRDRFKHTINSHLNNSELSNISRISMDIRGLGAILESQPRNLVNFTMLNEATH